MAPTTFVDTTPNKTHAKIHSFAFSPKLIEDFHRAFVAPAAPPFLERQAADVAHAVAPLARTEEASAADLVCCEESGHGDNLPTYPGMMALPCPHWNDVA